MQYEFEISRRRNTPVLSGGIGYSFVFNRSKYNDHFDITRGGLNYNLAAGYKFRTDKRDIFFSFGAQLQKVNHRLSEELRPEYYYDVVIQKRNVRRLGFTLEIGI